jgi:prevent-host-death family protein
MQVGVRLLKAHLSEYLTRVRAGEEVIVTDRGIPVARITPLPPGGSLPRKLQELVRAGRAVDKGPLRYLPEPVQMTPGTKTSTDFIREQRR